MVELIEFLNLSNLIIICHSYGALISSHFAERVADRIMAIFFVGAAGFTNKEYTEKEYEAIMEYYSRKWKYNPLISKMAKMFVWDMKINVFDYLSKGLKNEYVTNYFLSK